MPRFTIKTLMYAVALVSVFLGGFGVGSLFNESQNKAINAAASSKMYNKFAAEKQSLEQEILLLKQQLAACAGTSATSPPTISN